MYYVIGIDDNREQHLDARVSKIIDTHTTFSGGERHYEIMRPYLPPEHTWIPITVPLSQVIDLYRQYDDLVIFASGDPLFFGFGNTLLREMPEKRIQILPTFNSLQLLAHRVQMPYQDMHIVSLTGRPWDKLDEALIMGYEKIGILTDKSTHTPQSIALRMLQYGYDNYTMTVGELLGNSELERVSTYRLEEVKDHTFAYPNNIILKRLYRRCRDFGISESRFNLLNGRAKMITKMPIRLLSLSMLNLREAETFWDIGFCTGSVSIEAKRQFPHLKVVAFERREEGESLIRENAQKFGTPGIISVHGDFADLDLNAYPKPDAVFIGGHGGRMDEIVKRVCQVLTPKGCIVFNSVSEESRQLFESAVNANSLSLQESIRIAIDDHNPIEVMKAVNQA